MADLQAARNALAQRAQEVAGLNAQLADMAADLAAGP